MSANFEYYKVFYYVAKYRSFTQAAGILMSSQPSISRTMKILEDELGCTLFTRTQKGVVLTAEGQQLYTHISRACEEIFAGEKLLESTMERRSGVVRIGASETALHGFLLKKLESFHNVYPGIKLKVQNSSTPGAIEDLKEERVDFAVVTTPTGASRPLVETHLCPFQNILIGGHQLESLKGKVLRLEDLKNYPLICLAKGTKTYAFYEELFLSHKVSLTPDIEVATADLVLPMVTHNLGIGLIPEGLARQALENGEVFAIRLAETIPPRSICMVENSEKPLSITAALLKNAILSPSEFP